MNWNLTILTGLIPSKDWLLRNKVVVGLLLAVVASFVGGRYTAPGPNELLPGKPAGLYLKLPDGGVIEVPLPLAEEIDGRPVSGDVVPLSPWGQLALRAAIVVLERRAPRTESEWDDRLLVLLKAIGSDRRAFEAAERAVGR